MNPTPIQNGKAASNGEQQSLNRYAYVLNNPTTLTDPLGLTSLGMSAINCRPGTAGCKVLPSCHGMVCADQYYGGSMYPGFTSADQTTCTIDSVSANCNSAIADLQNGSATLLNITVNNPGAVAGSTGSILVHLPGTCSSVSFGNTSTSGTCWSGSDELVSVPGAGPSFQATNSGTTTSNAKPVLGYSGTVIFPIFWGLGPAATVSYVPAQHLGCIAPGIGASVGRTFSAGPIVGSSGSIKSTLKGFSVSAGYQFTLWAGAGGSGNSSGAVSGNTLGVPGASATFTYGFCY